MPEPEPVQLVGKEEHQHVVGLPVAVRIHLEHLEVDILADRPVEGILADRPVVGIDLEVLLDHLAEGIDSGVHLVVDTDLEARPIQSKVSN